jgi:hypothetical protein
MYVTGYQRVTIYVPEPGEPGHPDQGLPGFPEYPGQPLPRPPWAPRPPDPWLPEFPPGIGGGPVYPPGFPERPGQPLPRPPRPVYPVVPDPEDLGGHPELPDLNMTRRITISDDGDQFTGYVLMPEPPQVEEGYEPRLPTRGLPGTWVAVLYGSSLAWAWVRTPGVPGEPDQGGPDAPEREPKRY